jgi:polyisoprenoid-binding protein YceI
MLPLAHVLLVIMLLAARAAAQDTSANENRTAGWAVGTASVTFEIRNAGLPVRGSIGGLEATVCFDPDEPAAGRIVASVDPATIDTGIGLRDRHLARRGYFEVAKYGRIEMRSLSLDRTGTGYTGTFALRIRDIEREVEIPFTFEGSGANARIAGSLELDRLDYGIGSESLILSDTVTITVDLTLVRSAWSCR